MSSENSVQLARPPINATNSWVISQARVLISQNTTALDANEPCPCHAGEATSRDPEQQTLSPKTIEILEAAAARMEALEADCSGEYKYDDEVSEGGSSLFSTSYFSPPPHFHSMSRKGGYHSLGYYSLDSSDGEGSDADIDTDTDADIDIDSNHAMYVPFVFRPDGIDADADVGFLRVPRRHRAEDDIPARPASPVLRSYSARARRYWSNEDFCVSPSPITPGVRVFEAPEPSDEIIRPMPQRAGNLVVPEVDFRESPFEGTTVVGDEE
ncbi:hypothetical protein GGS21DRAFT_489334 [Xylaria nigripes]|nr:hypothetical protein GGS21DRAFT_489334 [Xylaria nigripes]